MLHYEIMYLVHVFLVHLVGSQAVVMGQRLAYELLVGYLLVSEQVADIRPEKLDRERLLDVTVRSGLQCFYTCLDSNCCGKQDYRHMAEVRIALYPVAELASVHYRHHYVAYDKVYLLLMCDFQRIRSVCCSKDVVFRRKFLCKIITHLRRVLYDQNAVSRAVEFRKYCSCFLLRMLYRYLFRLLYRKLQHE